MNTFPVLRFAVAAGLFFSLHAVIITIGAMAGVPGMRPFAELLTQFYGPYGRDGRDHGRYSRILGRILPSWHLRPDLPLAADPALIQVADAD